MAFNDEFHLLEACSQDLGDYLLSKVNEWRLSGPASFPPLTPGVILLQRKRLEGWASSEVEMKALFEVNRKIDTVVSQWQTAWQSKIGWELPMRLRLWKNVLAALEPISTAPPSGFRWQVRWRVMLQLLIQNAQMVPPHFLADLSLQDSRLQAFSSSGDFVWDQPLAKVFPSSNYWFLYRKI